MIRTTPTQRILATDGENRTPCIQGDRDDFRQEREGISLEVVEGMQFDRGYLRVRAAIGYQGERRIARLRQSSRHSMALMGASCYASDNRLVITDRDAEFGVFVAPQTQGLLSRGSQVRALPGRGRQSLAHTASSRRLDASKCEPCRARESGPSAPSTSDPPAARPAMLMLSPSTCPPWVRVRPC